MTSTRLGGLATRLLVVCSAAGCATPVLHPLRAVEGPNASMGITMGPHSGRTGSCGNPDGCQDSDTDGFSVTFLQASGGYATVVGGVLGIQGGLYLGASVDSELAGAP